MLSGPADGQHGKPWSAWCGDGNPGGSARGWDGDGRSPPKNNGTAPVRWSVANVLAVLALVPLVMTCLGTP